MKYLLDSNACIRYINGRAPLLIARLRAIPRDEIGVSIVTKAELYYGSAKSQTPQRSREKQQEFLQTMQTVPFDEAAALIYGDVRARLEKAGTPIGLHDVQIAAIALANNLILVTHNTGEFNRIPTLQLEDWEI